MNDTADGTDYFGLWKYFEDRATSVKGAMFATVTWVLGFAAGLLALIVSNLADYSPDALLDIKVIVSLLSFAGLSLCGYALYAIGESAKHIRNNWTYADLCMVEVPTLSAIVNPKKTTETDWGRKYLKGVPICKRLAIIVYMFAAAFVGVLILVWLLRCLMA